MRELRLTGEWRFRQVGEGNWEKATVPGCNYLDLMALGKLPDPFVGENEKETLWVAKQDWEYARDFVVGEDILREDVILLCCESLDTLCDIFINDACVAHSENSFTPVETDIRSSLKEGSNTLRIVFYSPLNYIEAQQEKDKMPRNNQGITGSPHIRKTQCHFGWDWGPTIPVSGIAGDISLRAYSSYRLADVRVMQTHGAQGVDLTVRADVQELPTKGDFHVKAMLLSPSGEVLGAREVSASGEEMRFRVEEPELWWTNDLSTRKTQPLYEVQVTLNQNGAVLDQSSKKIGLRTLELRRDADKWGHNFQFVLNGVPIFCKGASYIPADSMITRFTAEDRERLVRDCVAANMNMIRIWGGGNYETDAFYDACDLYGVLVWQDFAFACQPYPFYQEAFLANVKAEIAANVRRLRHHASLAIWCGNNELEVMSIAWRTRKNLMDWTEKFFYHILPELVAQHDSATPFISGSPIGEEYMKGFSADDDGDTHLWQVWHGLQPLNFYRRRMTRFCSEFGLESIPTMDAVRAFAQEKDYSLESDVFNAHQKSPSGNKKMLFYIAEKYRIPNRFTDLVYMTQLIQAEGVRDAVEHWRRNRGRCNGALYWQLNDCWPVNSWAGIDYLGRYKALHFAARQFNAPVSVSIEDTKKAVNLFVINDTLDRFAGTLRYRVVDFGGKVLTKGEQDITISATCCERIESLPLKTLLQGADKRKAFLHVQLLRDSKTVSERILLFLPEKKLELPACHFGVQAEIKDGAAHITIKSDLFARSVYVESPYANGNFSDNFIDILPGESVTLQVPVTQDATAEAVIKSLVVKTISGVTDTYSSLKSAWTRFKILMIPINFGQWIYYRML